MLIIDYLICNRDRHGANIEVLFNNNTKKYRIAPLFDHGLSLISPYYLKEDICSFDVKKDIKVNSFIGNSNLNDLIKYVPVDLLPKVKPDFKGIVGEIRDINEEYANKVLELLEWRWKCLEDIRNQK